MTFPMFKVTLHHWAPKIEQFEVVRKTPINVIVSLGKGRVSTQGKRTESSAWFDTFEEAKEYLMQFMSRAVRRSEKEMELTVKKMEEVGGMKP